MSARCTLGTTGILCLILAVAIPLWSARAADSMPLPPANAVTVITAFGSTLTIDPVQFRVYDIPQRRFEELTGIPPVWQSPQPPLGEVAARRAAQSGRVLTILVEWDNHGADWLFHPPDAYDSILYSDSVYPTGSVNDYYQEVSYGTYSLSGEVVGWVSLPSSYAGWYDIEEIINEVDPIVDFADYDGDGDGYVDAVWIIHAGPGQEETHDPNDIWSHAYWGVYVPTSDGVALNTWSVQPEEYANGDLVSIRVFCHEYGHILGLPDLYDYDDKLVGETYYTPNDWNDHPLVDWDVMGYAGYNLMSYGTAECPSHFSAWSRVALGWGAPEIPPCLDGTYQLYNVEEHAAQSIYKVPISDDGSEYFYLEYRNPRSSAKFDHLNSDFSAYFSWFTPGKDTLDAGLLITHIDESVAPNDGTPGSPHYAVRVVDAGDDPARPWDGVSEFSEWWYPYEFRIGALFSPDDPGQTILSPATTPSSAGYDGPTGITIEIIDQNSDFVTLNIVRPSSPIIEPAGPVTLVELEIVELPLTATDANCTVPSFSMFGTPALPGFISLNDLGTGTAIFTIAPQLGDATGVVVGVAASDGVLADTTYVQVTVTASCICSRQADFDANSFLEAIDLNEMISALFFNGSDPWDPYCPNSRDDYDINGFLDALDLNHLIEHLFFGGAPPCDPCLLTPESCATYLSGD